MKKYLSGLSAFVLAMMLVVSLTACGGGSSATSAVEGTWELSSMELNGVTVEKEEISQLAGNFSMTLEFNSGDKAIVTSAGIRAEGKYTLDGSKLTVTDSATTIDFEYDGTNIAMIEPTTGGKLIFAKQ